ncbi:MAG TPA: Mur ligase family protein, partial [Gemmatimonadales bacterium]|nr:Mur ligase family protein [Gemmatimonadales bacterium]
MLDAVGWDAEHVTARRFPSGASVAVSAPIDGLLSATEVNEWAVASASARVLGDHTPPFKPAVARIRRMIAREARPRLVALHAAAAAHDVTCLHDPDEVSVGAGTGAQTWRLSALPRPGEVDWSGVHDVPVVLVTGTNGKTTTVRLLAAVSAAAGRLTGYSCTDSVTIAGEDLDRGDWAGPAGARLVLRDRRVEFAVLETARGGILRRGLAATRAVAAIVTNVADDHFGEWGITDVRALAEAKLVVGRAVLPGGRLVLNADDATLVEMAHVSPAPKLWISRDADSAVVRRHADAGGDACCVVDGVIVLLLGGTRIPVMPVSDIPVTMGGAARHNVSNALGVAALAAVAGLPIDAIRAGLAGFRNSPHDNPGRLNVYRLGGATVLVDFAHNPHGMAAMAELAAALPARRRLLVIGQAGDRDDAALRALARSAWALRPDRIVLKEMEVYLRGRSLGEASDVMAAEFLALGAAPDALVRTSSEYDAVREALAWA